MVYVGWQVTALVAEIQRLPSSDKCLIFSEWDEVTRQQPLLHACPRKTSLPHLHALLATPSPRAVCLSVCVCVVAAGVQMLDVVQVALDSNHVRYGPHAAHLCLPVSQPAGPHLLSLSRCLLPVSAFSCVRLKGERKAGSIRAAFKQEADLRCLLLNLKSGGNGLTLVEANHVFLLEPIFNAATEAQAINRIHRSGQTKPTFVHRWVGQPASERGARREHGPERAVVLLQVRGAAHDRGAGGGHAAAVAGGGGRAGLGAELGEEEQAQGRRGRRDARPVRGPLPPSRQHHHHRHAAVGSQGQVGRQGGGGGEARPCERGGEGHGGQEDHGRRRRRGGGDRRRLEP